MQVATAVVHVSVKHVLWSTLRHEYSSTGMSPNLCGYFISQCTCLCILSARAIPAFAGFIKNALDFLPPQHGTLYIMFIVVLMEPICIAVKILVFDFQVYGVQ